MLKRRDYGSAGTGRAAIRRRWTDGGGFEEKGRPARELRQAGQCPPPGR
jgi:hypothetical protein